MADKPQFEMPESVRHIAEQNVEQARQAYMQFMEATRKAQTAMASGARDIQDKAFRFTQANMDASFDFASELAKARDVKEAFEIQAKFARQQMESFTQQAQELTRLMTDAAQKAQPKR